MANYRRRRRNRRRRRRLRMWPAAVRSCRCGLFAFATLSRDDDRHDDDDEQQQEDEQNSHDHGNDPEWKARLLFTFGLRLLAALDQAIYFRVLRKQALYFLEFRNCRRVILIPIIFESFAI